MKIVLVNVPHPAIGSRIPNDHLPPLGLLSIGGPLIDAGHCVTLIDGDLENLSDAEIVRRTVAQIPDAILFGHSGSTSGHPIIARVSRAVHAAIPNACIVYGGVYPTYHWREILAEEPYVAAIVRGEGEETAPALMRALERGYELSAIAGIAYRRNGAPYITPPATAIANLDDHRVGWELVEHRRYSYWGGRRAVILQFSRGCPHLCSYCGQRGFWTRWRHRDPVRFAREIARLYHEHGVTLINLADENPTSSRKAWRAFLEAMIAENVPVHIVGSTRADDIVRDADILHLYRKAGVIRWLLGTENSDENTLKLVKKGGSVTKDAEAVRLLRLHGMVSLVTWVAGFEEETDARLWRQLRQLLKIDADQIQALYVTPHRWTPFFRIAQDQRVIQYDRSRWDYKHQVLATTMPSWRLFLWVKAIEALVQSRPRAFYRSYLHPDPEVRHAMRWYSQMGCRVWPFEIWNYFFRGRRAIGDTLAAFWGAAQDTEEYSMNPAASRHAVRSFPKRASGSMPGLPSATRTTPSSRGVYGGDY